MCSALLLFWSTQLHKPLQFSTGPFTEYTHWKQTVFYLRQPITISKGESIKGKITVKPNDKVLLFFFFFPQTAAAKGRKHLEAPCS